MITKLDLCNMALLKIGEKPIITLQEDSVNAELANRLFDTVINFVLSSHPWVFAKKKIRIIPDQNGDLIIPADILRVINSGFEIIGNKINLSSDFIDIIAITKVQVEDMPDFFTSVLATKLAMEFCIPLTGDQVVFRMLTALYENDLRNAKFIDSTTSFGNEISDFSLISIRG